MLVEHRAHNFVVISDSTVFGLVTLTPNFINYWFDGKDDMPIVREDIKKLPTDFTINECNDLIRKLRDIISTKLNYGDEAVNLKYNNGKPVY